MLARADAAASPLALAQLDSEELRWDAFVNAAADASFCHLSAWRAVMCDALGHDARYLVALDDAGEWQGVLPLVRVRSRLFGDQLVSMPFLNYGGAAGTTAARAFLTMQAAALGRRLGVDLLELRTRTACSGLETVQRKVTVLLPLPSTAEELWSRGLPAKLRSQIRRPQKVGMDVRFGAEQLPAFYEVYARNMRDLGTPVLPWQFFEALPRMFGARVIVATVYARDIPVAASCGFLWHDEFEITWASSLREFNAHAPNMLLYWSCMEHVIARGARTFNFGRCTPDGGTHRFKLQWGGRTIPLPWLQWARRARRATPSAERPLYRVATRLWSHLPLGVASRVGPLLARSLP